MNHLSPERKFFRLKIITTVVAVVLIISTAREFTRFEVYNEKGVRFQQANESIESEQGIRICYTLDVLFGFWLLTIWMASLRTLHTWMIGTLIFALLISYNFISSGPPNGYIPSWQTFVPLVYFLAMNRIISRYWN